jgi:hypothetical protein
MSSAYLVYVTSAFLEIALNFASRSYNNIFDNIGELGAPIERHFGIADLIPQKRIFEYSIKSDRRDFPALFVLTNLAQSSTTMLGKNSSKSSFSRTLPSRCGFALSRIFLPEI